MTRLGRLSARVPRSWPIIKVVEVLPLLFRPSMRVGGSPRRGETATPGGICGVIVVAYSSPVKVFSGMRIRTGKRDHPYPLSQQLERNPRAKSSFGGANLQIAGPSVARRRQ